MFITGLRRPPKEPGALQAVYSKVATMEPSDQESDSSEMEKKEKKKSSSKFPALSKKRISLVSLWLVSTCGTCLIIASIIFITFVVQPRAMRSTQSHNFISINPVGDTDNGAGVTQWVNDYSNSVMPVPVHSHNDYWRPRPLFSALAAGCSSVEADVWLAEDGKDLLVGHHVWHLSKDKTLRSMYVDPMRQILDNFNTSNRTANMTLDQRANGIFKTDPEATLVLLIDVKSGANETWPLVMQQLEPLRERGYLTRIENGTLIPGAITVVGSGNVALSPETMGSGCEALSLYQDGFLDAPLPLLGDPTKFSKLDDCEAEAFLNIPLVKYYTASAPFRQTIGLVGAGFTASQKQKLRDSLEAAQAKGLVSRYWQLPKWPISLRDAVWDTLAKEGVGLLNADDIESATRLEWNNGYRLELIWIGASSGYIFVISLVLMWLYNRSFQMNQQKSRNESDEQPAYYDELVLR